jgi:hypothetical protein
MYHKTYHEREVNATVVVVVVVRAVVVDSEDVVAMMAPIVSNRVVPFHQVAHVDLRKS